MPYQIRKNTLKFALITRGLLLFLCTNLLISSPAFSAIYFNAKVSGPVTNIYNADPQGSITKLTDNFAWRDLQFSVSKNNGLFFMSNRQPEVQIDLNRTSEVFNIYRLNPKTNAIEPLTNSVNHDVDPQLSADGRSLVFTRFVGKQREVYLIDLETNTEKKILTAENIYGYSWANTHNTLSIAIKQGDKTQLLTLDPNTLKQHVLLETQRKNLGNNESRNLTDYQKWTEVMTPVWSPNDDQIAFILHPTQQGKMRQLASYDVETANITIVSPSNINVQAPIQWSQTNNLLYSGLKDYRYYYNEQTQRKTYEGSMQIFLSSLKQSTVQLTQGNHLHSNPVFSPDGRQIAYLYSDKLGGARQLSLRTMSLDGSNKQQLFDRVSKQSSLLWR